MVQIIVDYKKEIRNKCRDKKEECAEMERMNNTDKADMHKRIR